VFPNGLITILDDEVSSSRSGIRPDKSADVEVKEFLSARCSDTYAIGANGGASQSNCSDASLLHPNACFTESTRVLQILRS
jgi:hypothetical protein